MKRVAIVGGGPTAVFAAFLLEQKTTEELDVTLFEAQGRLGGKIQTARFGAASKVSGVPQLSTVTGKAQAAEAASEATRQMVTRFKTILQWIRG